MARTKGSISNVSVNFQDLKSLLGEKYQGLVTVNANWLEGVTKPGAYIVKPHGETVNQVKAKAKIKSAPAQKQGRKAKFAIAG